MTPSPKPTELTQAKAYLTQLNKLFNDLWQQYEWLEEKVKRMEEELEDCAEKMR